MSLEANLKRLSARVPQALERLETEEATKNALVMPFIAALGYDVFDPAEVVLNRPGFLGDSRKRETQRRWISRKLPHEANSSRGRGGTLILDRGGAV